MFSQQLEYPFNEKTEHIENMKHCIGFTQRFLKGKKKKKKKKPISGQHEALEVDFFH